GRARARQLLRGHAEGAGSLPETAQLGRHREPEQAGGAEGGDALLGEAALLVDVGTVPSHDVERQRQLAGFETVRMRHRTLLRPARGAEPSEVIVWGNRHATRWDASSGE